MDIGRDQINIENFKGNFYTGSINSQNINEKSDVIKSQSGSSNSIDEKIQQKNASIEQILDNWGFRPGGFSHGKREQKKADIEKWLRRFLLSEFEDAFLILERIQYHDSHTVDGYMEGLSRELNKIFDNDLSEILFYPLGESPASSGGNLLYSFRKYLGLPESSFPYVPFEDIDLSEKKAIIFFDDIIGSGNQAVRFAQEHLKDKKIDKYYVALMAFEKGLEKVRNNGCFEKVIVHEIISEELRAFSPESHVFPDTNTRERIKILCEKYGALLYPKHPLGYDDSQALIVFPHNTPNNTLPIIWASDKNEKESGYVWYPVWERIKRTEKKQISEHSHSMNPSIITNMPGNSNISGSIKEYLEKIIDDAELQAKEIIPVSLRLVEIKENEQTVFDVSELVKKESKLIILGGSGSGKTITLKRLNVIYANRCLKDEVSKIPVYLELNLYNKGTFYDYARKNVKNNWLSESAFDSLLNDNKIIFLIDGLDLLSPRDQFNPYSEIWDFITDHNDCRYVVSSRQGFFGHSKGFKVSELEGLNDEKIGLFIDKYPQDNKIFEPLKNKILGDEKLKSLFSNPLMLDLAIKVASRQKKGEILPSKRSQMYMEFIDGMFKHDSSKMPQAHRHHSNKQQILETLTDIYFYMQCRNEVSMDYSDALEIASKHSGDLRYKPVPAASILDDIFTVGLIPKTDSVLTYGIHQSFQEYFSALKLKEYFEKGFDVSEAFRHPKWEEVVLFASEMFDCPDDFVRSMINSGELDIASKCAQNTGNDIKEDLCIRLADKYDSRFLLDKTKAIESLSRLGELAISVIIAALHHENVNLRWKAAVSLGEIKTEKAVDLLIAALSDENNIVRWMAAITLGKIKSEKAVDALIAALSNENENVRWNAADVLGKIKSEKAVDALKAALSHENEGVRRSVTYALGKINSEKEEYAPIAGHSYEGMHRRAMVEKSDNEVLALIETLHNENEERRVNAAFVLGEICKIRHEGVLKKLAEESKNEFEANAAYEILQKIKLRGNSETKLFQKKPAKIIRGKKSNNEKVVTAQSPETGAFDPYFHIAIYEINKIKESTAIVDYGCGYGKLLTPMKNLGADVLDNIHYIGVDAKTACRFKSYWTAEKYGLFKNQPEFMTPEVFFKKDITVDLALLMHTLHEIRLVDLVDSIYHITAKLPVGGQIFILEPGSFIEERNYVLWKDTDFKMIFSNHGFDVMPYPITTNKGNKLNAVNIIKNQNENFPKDTVAEKCLLMFEAKKKEPFRMLNNNPTGIEKDKEIDLLYSYVSRQIDEYKAI